MRHVNKLLGGLVVALPLLLGAYAGGYLAMLDDTARIEDLFIPGPHYRWRGEQVRTFFAPAYAIDRKLRPQRYRPLFVCPSHPPNSP